MAAAKTSGAAGKQNRGRMLISCPDRPGIVAAVSKFLSEYGANIVQSDQYTMDPEGGMFFIRIEFDLTDLEQRKPQLEADFAGVAAEFSMDWSLSLASQRKRLAIFVSKEDHCLLELLWHWRAGDLDADIAMVVSNHPDMAPLVEPFGIPYHHIPVTPDTKAEVEKRHLELLEGQVDLIILARYMQIIPASLSSITRTGSLISIIPSFRLSSEANLTRRLTGGELS